MLLCFVIASEINKYDTVRPLTSGPFGDFIMERIVMEHSIRKYIAPGKSIVEINH